MFSHRTPADLSHNRLTELLQALRIAETPITDLTSSNPTTVGFSSFPDTLESMLGKGARLQYAPDPRGLWSAREAIAAYYSESGCALTPDDVHCTSSSSEAYSMLFKLLCDPGDEVLFPQPSYPLFRHLTALDNIALRWYRLRRTPMNRWRMDILSLVDGITANTRAIVIVNPSNPAGNYIQQDEWEQLQSLCRKRNIALIIDEVFHDFRLTEEEAFRTAGAVGEALSFTISGLSKMCALPQLKLSWILSGGATALRREAQMRLDFIADAYLSVGSPVMTAAKELLALRRDTQLQITQRLQENLRSGRAILGEGLLPVEGGWNVVLDLPHVTDDEDWACTLLEEEGILVHPGALFDFDDGAFAVLSLLTEPEDFKQGIQRIAKRI
jgi:alanine-synthesizing transaminase